MPVVPPPLPKTDRESQIQYYANFLADLPGVYQGSVKQYQGMTWAHLYETIAPLLPKYSPKTIADKVLGVETAQQFGKNTTAIGAFLGDALKTAEKAAADTNFAAGVPGASALTGIAAIGQFFNNLGNANTWIRVAKVLLGGVLMVVGLAKMAGVDKGIIGAAVKKAPLL